MMMTNMDTGDVMAPCANCYPDVVLMLAEALQEQFQDIASEVTDDEGELSKISAAAFDKSELEDQAETSGDDEDDDDDIATPATTN